MLANRSAGSVQDPALGGVLAVLARAGPTELRLTGGPDDIDDALRELDGRRPVVAGGDGTLHLAVNRLRSLGLAGVPVALVPLGTGNDLARGVGLPLDPVEAAGIAVGGRPRPLAVAVHHDSGETIINNVHTGLGERAARRAAGLKSRLGPLAYPAGALLAGVRPGSDRVALGVDGTCVFDGRSLALVIALGPSAGGGHRVAPDAEPTDATLDVVLVEAGSAMSRLAVGAAVVAGRDPSRRPDVQRWTGQAVEVEHVGRATARWDLDGEDRTWPSPMRVTVEPAGWRLVL